MDPLTMVTIGAFNARLFEVKVTMAIYIFIGSCYAIGYIASGFLDLIHLIAFNKSNVKMCQELKTYFRKKQEDEWEIVDYP